MISPNVRKLIESRLADYLNNPDEEPIPIRPIARKHSALPVYRDIGGSLLLSPNGDVLSLSHDDDVAMLEESQEWKIVALVSAAAKYPELSCLLPKRPPGMDDCEECAGSGRVLIGSLKAGCGSCHGLGWPPAL